MSLFKVQEKKIDTFHMRCLRRILKIRWQQKITNEEVLRRAGLKTMCIVLVHHPHPAQASLVRPRQ